MKTRPIFITEGHDRKEQDREHERKPGDDGEHDEGHTRPPARLVSDKMTIACSSSFGLGLFVRRCP
jgi:hypothetical protein